MNKKAIIYLHGFNSASLDLNGDLLTSKEKLRVMRDFCADRDIEFFAPNVDYRDFQKLIEDMLFEWKRFSDKGYDIVFMGSSMGGFAGEYLAMKTGAKAVLINPAIRPSELLPQFVGVTENYETGLPYRWERPYCDQYRQYEREMADGEQAANLTILLDLADELLDAEQTRDKYRSIADVVAFDGGSHSFEHMQHALPVVERILFSG